MKKKSLIVIAAAGVVALGGGTAVALADDDARERVVRTVTGNEPAKTDLTVEQAIAKAQEAVKGTVESVELEDGGSVWELDVLAEDGSWREAAVAADGKVTQKASDDDADDAEDAEDAEDRAEDRAEADALKAAKVSAAQAAATAAGSVSGTVLSVELEGAGREKPAWKVEIRDGEGVEHEVLVDAAEDKVLSSQVDADDEDDDDEDGDD